MSAGIPGREETARWTVCSASERSSRSHLNFTMAPPVLGVLDGSIETSSRSECWDVHNGVSAQRNGRIRQARPVDKREGFPQRAGEWIVGRGEAPRRYPDVVGEIPTMSPGGWGGAHAPRVRARILFDSIEKTARDKPEYDRELALFYCNHDRELPKALELAKRDLTLRQDIFAHDTLAWALVKSGRAKEAETEMTAALKIGGHDASLYYHAGVIYDKLGDREKARDFLKRALALNPHFSISQADAARRLLGQEK